MPCFSPGRTGLKKKKKKSMSTSDAAERRAVGERATPLCSTTQPRTQTARKQNETPANHFENQHVVEAGPCHPLITRKETSTGLACSSKTTNDFTDNSSQPKFTSHLSFKLKARPGLNKTEPDPHTKTDTSTGRPSSLCGQDVFYRVHDLTVYSLDKIPLHVRRVEKSKDCISIVTTSGNIQSFSNGYCGPFTENASQSGLPPRRANSLDLNVDNVRAKDLSGHSTMLSSTVATVLAPQWNGRLRRNKREGAGTFDFQGNLPGSANSSSGVERMLSSGLRNQLQAPFVRSNTVGWSTRSGPTGLDNERKVQQSASLDMRLDDKRTDRPLPSPLSPLSPASPMSIDANEPQRSPQRGHSPLSSKPTTSSMLLSLRRVNNNSPMSPTESQTQSPENLDTNRQFSTHLSQTFQHKNQLSPNSIVNNGNPPLSPSPTHRDRLSKSYNYSTLPSKHAESPYSQANSSQESVSPQRTFSRDPPDSIKLNKKPLTLPKRTPYDHTALLKSHSTPRRPLLSSISWLPVDSQEGSSQITSNDNNNKSDTPFNGNNFKPDNAGVNRQIPNYRGNKNIEELAGKANLMKLQGGTASAQQPSPNHLSFVKGQVDSRLNMEPPKPMSLPGALSNSKFSSAAPHTAMSQAKAPNSRDASSGLYSTKVTPFSPTLLSPKSSYTPTDNSSKYQNMYCASKATPTMQQNKEKVGKQSHLLDITNMVTNANNKTSLDLGQSNKLSFQSTPGSAQVNSSTSTFSKEEMLSPKLNTPLGFERSYVPKPYQAKTNLSPTVSLYSQTSYSPTHASSTPPASSPSYLSPHSPPVSISSLLTPPSTPSYNSPSSPRTPSPKINRTSSNSVDSDPKKQKGEKKISKRVTFEDTVNANTDEKQEQLNQLTQRNIKAPSIFNVLRSGNHPNTFCPTPKSSSIQIGPCGKYRSLSSDSAELKSRDIYKQLSSENAAFDPKRPVLNIPRQERTLSAESAVQYRCSAPLSLPPDFANGYKNRYSSPPYSTLVSSRTSQPEAKPKPPVSPLFHRHSQPNILNTMGNMATTLPKQPLLPSSSLQLRPVQIDTQDTFKSKGINLDQVNNNQVKSVGEAIANGHIQLVDNRVHVSSQSLPGDKSPRIASCVTETLVYSIRGKADRAIDGTKNAAPKGTANMHISKEAGLSQQMQRKEALKEQDDMSNQSSSSSVESHNIDDDSSKRKIKEVGKSKFYSIECSSAQSPKRSRFALKKSPSTPNTSLSRSDSERTSKMDQVISKIKQTFSTRRSSNEEESFPKKWKKGSQVPSLSAMSDSSTSDVTVESNRTVEEEEVTMELNNNEKGVEDKHRWASNRYTLVPAPIEQSKVADDKFAMWTDEVMTDPEESRSSPHLKTHSPIQDHESFDFKPNHFLSPKDHSPAYSPTSSTAFPSTDFRKSSTGSRSPFSPFPSLSPVSPFPPADVLDDSVFYSPKPPRHRDSSSSPCELGEISLVASRRSRASTGPPSLGPVTTKQRASTSYADLKYGIEPGRSFSVSSVSSSRPSGPGRISTGSRFMSVGDLTKTTFSCGHTAGESDNWSAQGDQTDTDSQAGRYSNDGKVRSRSLPRSFTQCLSNWGTGQSASSSQNVDTVDFTWETEGPPTPPPTPPMSPVTRRMSKPPSLSPPSFTGQSEPPQDSQSPRGLLPSRGYTSSLSTFEESSDSSSDTTTDDEYYLETGEDEEKETEL